MLLRWLALLLLSPAAARGKPHMPPAPRQCRTSELAPGADPEFGELPESSDGRVPVPFVFGLDDGGDRDAALVVLAATGDLLDGNSFYSLAVDRLGVTVARTSASGKTSVLESFKIRQLLPGGGPGHQPDRGYYFRLKVRQEYVSVGLYEAGDDAAADPVASFKDQDPIQEPLTHYAFQLRSRSPRASARLLTGCRARLDAPCVHASECVDHGSLCAVQGGEPKCDCDEDHIR